MIFVLQQPGTSWSAALRLAHLTVQLCVLRVLHMPILIPSVGLLLCCWFLDALPLALRHLLSSGATITDVEFCIPVVGYLLHASSTEQLPEVVCNLHLALSCCRVTFSWSMSYFWFVQRLYALRYHVTGGRFYHSLQIGRASCRERVWHLV